MEALLSFFLLCFAMYVRKSVYGFAGAEDGTHCASLAQRCADVPYPFKDLQLSWPLSSANGEASTVDKFCRELNITGYCAKNLTVFCPDHVHRNLPHLEHGGIFIAEANIATAKLCGTVNPIRYYAAREHCTSQSHGLFERLMKPENVQVGKFDPDTTNAKQNVCRIFQTFLANMNGPKKTELQGKCGVDVVDVLVDNMNRMNHLNGCSQGLQTQAH